MPWGTKPSSLAPAIKDRIPFDLAVAADCTYDFVKPELPAPTTDALLSSLQMCARRALVCVSRRINEVEAFEAALARASLEGTVVFTGCPGGPSEGVAECLVYELVFSEDGNACGGMD
eukprot:gnl/MRDRNA2_/MRDRNA2_173118_c0_seq1.p1 gnl/MRDRNA2_/MRDRNA2_173118_c0~~gnl/MRDRNA2_/MRDRNA2_173118_c0_seq1.p1  ORF type:complete len:118 (-),score=17.56 gnl/MRDRNA2_/MRDRNA2_173118_c0_seq1:112-465(-)